eukprot:360343-Chlamydomonas_euryale.AAC.3
MPLALLAGLLPPDRAWPASRQAAGKAARRMDRLSRGRALCSVGSDAGWTGLAEGGRSAALVLMQDGPSRTRGTLHFCNMALPAGRAVGRTSPTANANAHAAVRMQTHTSQCNMKALVSTQNANTHPNAQCKRTSPNPGCFRGQHVVGQPSQVLLRRT